MPASGQIGFLPAQARELLCNDAVGPLLGGLSAELSRMALAQLSLHQLDHLLSELFAAQAPASAQRLKLLLISLGEAAGFHLSLKLPKGV